MVVRNFCQFWMFYISSLDYTRRIYARAGRFINGLFHMQSIRILQIYLAYETCEMCEYIHARRYHHHNVWLMDFIRRNNTIYAFGTCIVILVWLMGQLVLSAAEQHLFRIIIWWIRFAFIDLSAWGFTMSWEWLCMRAEAKPPAPSLCRYSHSLLWLSSLFDTLANNFHASRKTAFSINKRIMIELGPVGVRELLCSIRAHQICRYLLISFSTTFWWHILIYFVRMPPLFGCFFHVAHTELNKNSIQEWIEKYERYVFIVKMLQCNYCDKKIGIVRFRPINQNE